MLWWISLYRPLNGLATTQRSNLHNSILKPQSLSACVSTLCSYYVNNFESKCTYKQQRYALSSSLDCDKPVTRHRASDLHPPVFIGQLETKSSWRPWSPQHKHLHQTLSVPAYFGYRCFSASTNRQAATGLKSTVDVAGVASAVASSRPLWFPDFPTIHLAESFITFAHSLTGLPWWSTIVLTTLACRMGFMMLPAIYKDINQKRLERLAPELQDLQKKVKADVIRARMDYGWSEKKCKTMYQKKMSQLAHERHLRDNCHPLKSSAVFWFQLPLWLSVSFALRNMSTRAANPLLENHSSYVGYMSEGIAWIPDLTAVDSTLILPVLMSAFTLFNIEMMYLTIPNVTLGRKLLIYVLRCFALVFIPLGSQQPSAMVLYWVISAICASGQTLILNYSPFRRLIKLPQSNSESNMPFRFLLEKARIKYKRKTQ